MVQNLLTAVGSAPYVSRPTCRTRRGATRRGCSFACSPSARRRCSTSCTWSGRKGWSAPTLQLRTCRPTPPPMRPDGSCRGARTSPRRATCTVPSKGLARLADKLGEDRLFIGPAFQQADEAAFGWPDLGPITGLEGANRALERIVEQGEGATGDWEAAHYGRFLGVLQDYLAMRQTDPGFNRPTRSWLLDERGGGDRGGCLCRRPCHRRVLRPVQRRVCPRAPDDRALLRLRPREAGGARSWPMPPLA